MNNLHCYKFLKCIIFLSHICPRSLINQTVSLYAYGFVCIYHKMLATAKSKKIDSDIRELFPFSPVPLDLKAELLNLPWVHGQRCHMKQELSSTNSKWSQGNLYFNWWKEKSCSVSLPAQEWFSFGQVSSALSNKMHLMLWSHQIWFFLVQTNWNLNINEKEAVFVQFALYPLKLSSKPSMLSVLPCKVAMYCHPFN